MLKNAARVLAAITLTGILSLAAVTLTAPAARADSGDEVAMGAPTRDIAFSPDSSLAYVSGGNNLIKVVDAATHAVLDTIALPGIVGGIAMSPDGATLYATEGTNNDAYAINTSTRAIGAPIAVGDDPAPVVVTPDGAFAYVGNLVDQTVTVIDTSTLLVVDTVALPISPSKLRVAPDGSMVWALSFSSPTAVAIDTTTHATSPLNPNPMPSTTAVLDVIYADANGEVLFVTFDGADAAVWVYLLPSWTPGGPMSGLPLGSPLIAGAVNPAQDILWLISIGSATISSFPGGATAPTGASPWSLSVRPDGLEVWVANAGGQSVTIFTRPYAGGEPNASLPGAPGDTVTIDSAVPAGTYDSVRWQYYDFDLATWQDLPGETGPTLDVVLDATTMSYRYRLVATSAVFGEVLSGQWAVGSPAAGGGGTGTLADTGADGAGVGIGTTTGIAGALVVAGLGLTGLAHIGARRSRRA